MPTQHDYPDLPAMSQKSLSTHKMGDLAICAQCGRQIQYVGPHWRHAIDGKGVEYRHMAKPVEIGEAS